MDHVQTLARRYVEAVEAEDPFVIPRGLALAEAVLAIVREGAAEKAG